MKQRQLQLMAMLLVLISTLSAKANEPEYIEFADQKVEEICVSRWDTDGDGKLSMAEAAVVTSIGGFSGTEITSFDELQYFTNLETIEWWGFRLCSKLTSVTLPNSVTKISDAAFHGCSSLSAFNIPASVTTIEGAAFSGCDHPITLTLANSVASIANGAFDDCNITIVHSEITNPQAGNPFLPLIHDAVVIVPGEYLDKYQSTDGWKELRLVDVSDPTLTTYIDFADKKVEEICINNWDLNGDGKLSMLESSIVKSLDGFGGTVITSFDELHYFTGLTKIDNNAFDGCSDLASIIIPNTVTNIGDCGFRGCSSLTSIEIPSSVTIIEGGAFENTGLTSIAFPNSLTTIGVNAFQYCSSLTEITIPSSVTSVGGGAFRGCNIRTVRSQITDPEADNPFLPWIPNATIYVPKGTKNKYLATDGWKDLTIVDLNEPIEFADKTVERICVAQWDTDGDGGLSITEAGKVKTLGGFSGTDIKSFEEVIYFTEVTAIADNAFADCSSLTAIKIPESVTTIGNSAFYGCSALSAIDIPESVMTIGKSAFQGCTRLESLIINGSPSTIGTNSFDGCEIKEVTSTITDPQSNNPFLPYIQNATIYVPRGTEDKYLECEGWKDLKLVDKNIPIDFADQKVEEICVSKWDTDGDGKLSMAEAEKVISIVGFENTEITSFDEMKYFANLRMIARNAFSGCGTFGVTIKE